MGLRKRDAFVAWREEYSVGLVRFDDEHKVMIGMISTLHESMRTGQAVVQILPIIDGLIAYTLNHFAHEEQAFLQTGYPSAVVHRLQHEKLKAQVMEFRARASFESSSALALDLAQFLHDWLIVHIQQDDRRYGQHLAARGFV